ncbi:MAG: TrmH family RNA methyltransferase [Pirellulaceae bacterium]
MLEINSLQNSRIKDAVRLRNRRERRSSGRTLIDGVRELTRALACDFPVTEVFFSEAVIDPADLAALRAVLHKHPQVEMIRVSEPVLEKLSFGDRLEGVVAVARCPVRNLADIPLGKNPLIVVLERVEKPGNLGALLRTLDAVGGDLLISADGQTDLYNPNVIRASSGAVFRVPVVEATTEETLTFLCQIGATICAARVDGSRVYTELDYRDQPIALVLGNEAEGLTDRWTGIDIEAIHLPMRGIADSLNVSTTAAVLLYEVLRQRSQS